MLNCLSATCELFLQNIVNVHISVLNTLGFFGSLRLHIANVSLSHVIVCLKILRSSMVWHKSVLQSFLWMNNVSLHGNATFCLSVISWWPFGLFPCFSCYKWCHDNDKLNTKWNIGVGLFLPKVLVGFSSTDPSI